MSSRRLAVRTPFDAPLALFALSAMVGVWAAYDRQVAWSKFWLIAAGIGLFYALSAARSLGLAAAWLASLLGAALAVYFLDTHDWATFPAKLDAVTRLGQAVQVGLFPRPGRPLNSNEVGGILAAIAPFGALAASDAWRAIRRCARPCPPGRWLALGAALALLAVALFGLLMSTSRGAWVALAVALLAGGWWAATMWLARHGRARQAWLLSGALVAVLALGMAAAPMSSHSLLAVPTVLPGPDTWSGRVALQRNSLILAQDYAFTGAGLGGFQMVCSTYALLLHVGYVTHSYNLFLNVAIDQGLPGLLALGWSWLLVAGAVWHSRVQPAAGGLTELGAAAMALIVVLVHGLADNALYGVPGTALLFVPLAFAVPAARQAIAERPASRRRWRMLGWAAGICLVAVPIAVWHGPLASAFYANLGVVHQSQAELSVYRWPEWPVQDAVRRAVDLSRPVTEFERALALDPGNATANRRLGMIELSLGRYDAALKHLQAAYRAEPATTTTAQLLGEALLVNGRSDEGRALWSGLSNEQHQLTLRAFWYDHIGDGQRADALRAAINDR